MCSSDLNAGTLTEIATPLVGWNTVNNTEDSVPGLDDETDEELIIRGRGELQKPGTGPVNAIRADLLDVDGVTSVTVFENVDDIADATGLPGHAIECMVLGGADADIAQQIFDSKPAGTQAYGTTVITSVTDDAGNNNPISFTRPTVVDVYLELDLVVDLGDYSGSTTVKEALVSYGDSLALGEDVVIAKLICVAVSQSGVADVSEVRVGIAASPTSTDNLEIDSRALAEFDTSRIVINTVST